MQLSTTRRFGPLGLALAVQLGIILVAPSTGVVASRGHETSYGVEDPGAGPAGQLGVDAPGARSNAPSAAGTGLSGVPGGRSAAVRPGATGSAAAYARDTSHCVGGRAFSVALDYFAPPCVPGTIGAPYPGNGGATWQGVTSKTIEVVDYVPDYGAALDTLIKAEGLYESYDNAREIDRAYQAFINKNYVLYGRSVHITAVQGTCQTIPPDEQCLIPEMDKIVAKYHPYAVYWRSSLCSACYAELSRLRVVNFGGTAFSDAYHNANAPYSYDAHESVTRTVLAFADWWCAEMTSNGSTRRVAFAGKQNPAQDFNGKPRVLGVLANNDPDQEATVKNVLYPALKKGCGESVTHEYFYEQDVSTAEQQVSAGIAAMDTSSNPATTVLCLCDGVAPGFFYNAMHQRNYWPENVFSADQWMDYDTSGQSFGDNDGQPSLGCPTPQRGCEFDGAFGLSEREAPQPAGATPGLRVYRAGGGAGLPVTSATLDDIWSQFNMMASLMQNTGPLLTPAGMQAAAPAMGSRGGGSTGHQLRGFSRGNWCWTQDMRLVYWNKHRLSPYNGVKGTFVQVGPRYDLGDYPRRAQPPVPPADQRS